MPQRLEPVGAAKDEFSRGLVPQRAGSTEALVLQRQVAKEARFFRDRILQKPGFTEATFRIVF